jgi:hypothetical protein
MLSLMSRKYIPLKVKLAAALLKAAWPAIPHEQAKLMTADQICSLFQWDHWPIPVAHDGPDEPWNLEPRFIGEHRKKTAKIDVPAIAKVRRISRKHRAHEDAMRADKALDAWIKEKRADAMRRWPKARKIQSRNNLRKRR